MGHDVLTIQETGTAGQSVPDEDILAFAVREDRALLTLNRKHFVRLHCNSPQHSGLIVCTLDPDFAALACRIHEAIKAQDRLASTDSHQPPACLSDVLPIKPDSDCIRPPKFSSCRR
ncbi:DUF5615 family PIN-like protein [Chloroflexota bacterium]